MHERITQDLDKLLQIDFIGLIGGMLLCMIKIVIVLGVFGLALLPVLLIRKNIIAHKMNRAAKNG